MLLYADEDFAFPMVEELRLLGHDVLTAQEDGRRAASDPHILAGAHTLGGAFLTYNRWDYERLDRQGAAHTGILSAPRDEDYPALAARIHAALAAQAPGRWCLRVNRPPPNP